jgi:tetratricopeptide (TPR) repeat protein
VRVDGALRARPRDAERWGRFAEAAIRRMGGDDTREATLLRTLATAVTDGDPDARARLIRARSLYEKSPEPQRAFHLANLDETLAAVAFFAGRAEEALATYRRVEEARERLFGPEHLSVAFALMNEADCLARIDRVDEAVATARRAIAVAEASQSGAADTYLRERLADALRRGGDFRAALAEDTRVIEARERAGSAGDVRAAPCLAGQGLDLLGLGRAAEAIAPLERAADLFARGAARATDLADARFALARALVAAGADEARARGLAEQARDAYRPFADRHGGWYRVELTAIERWLASPQRGP